MVDVVSPDISPVRTFNSAIFFQKYSTLLVLLLLFVGFSVAADRFLTASNLVNILQQISMLTIVAIGLTFGFAVREIDLSVGFITGFVGIICPMMIASGVPIALAVILALAAGAFLGLINAGVVVGIGVPSLITTLAMGSILGGLTYLVSGGRAIFGLTSGYLALGQGKFLGVLPFPALIMLGLVILSGLVLEKTIFGRYLYATGGNPRAAQLSGINTTLFRAAGLILSGLFASAAGILLSARLGAGQPGNGESYLLDGLAAVFIGMTMLRPGTATVLGTFFGALLMGVMNNGLNLVGMDSYVQAIVKGLVIIIAVSVVSRTRALKLL